MSCPMYYHIDQPLTICPSWSVWIRLWIKKKKSATKQLIKFWSTNSSRQLAVSPRKYIKVLVYPKKSVKNYSPSRRSKPIKHSFIFKTQIKIFLLKSESFPRVTLVNGGRDWPEEKKLLDKVIFVFFAHKKYSCSFIKLQLNHWCHMDYFNDALTTFLGLEHFSCIAVYAGSESSRISAKISSFVFWSLMGLERQESE